MTRLSLLCLSLACAGCSLDSVFACASNEACEGAGPGGRCEPEGWCSFEDTDCPLGRRYAPLAGDGLGGVCLGDAASTDGSSSSGSSSSGSDATSTSTSTSTTTGPDQNVPFGPWWDCQWGARVAVTMSNVDDLSGPFDDVVVLAALGPGRIDLQSVASGGADLRFIAADHETELPYEIDVWDDSAGSFLWVRVPTVDEGTQFFIYYDGPGDPPSFDPAQAWPDAYRAVWHFEDDGADSTSNDNLASGMVGVASGRVGSSIVTYDFETSAQYTVPPNGTLDNIFATGGTVSAWMRMSAHGEPGERELLRKASGFNGVGGWVIELQEAALPFEFQRGHETGRNRFEGATLPLHTWVHVSMLYDDSADIESAGRLVVDGVEVPLTNAQTTGFAGLAADDSAAPVTIGTEFRGRIDEARIRVGGTVDEAILDYRSQSDQLLTYGPEDRSGCFDNPEG